MPEIISDVPVPDVNIVPASPAGLKPGLLNVPNIPLKVQKLSTNAIMPTKGTELSAGFDLSAAYDYEIPAGGKECVKTDLAILMPAGVYGRVAPRSGLAAKKHIDVGAGVIDADYRGNIGVVLFNHAKEPFKIERGDRIAQLILEYYMNTTIEEVAELPSSERGAGGFGSTGGSKTLGAPSIS